MAFDNANMIYQHSITSNSVIKHFIINENNDETDLFIGNEIYRFDKSGLLTGTHRLNSDIISVLDTQKDRLIIALANGNEAVISTADNTVIEVSSFASECDSVTSLPSDSYLALKDGNLHFYEYVNDSDFVLYDGHANWSFDDSTIISNTLITIDPEGMSFFSTAERKQLKRITFNDGNVYHLLDNTDDMLYLLKADSKTSELSVISYSVENGIKQNEIPLGVTDYYFFRGFMSDPLSVDDIRYISLSYRQPAAGTVRDHVLYVHGYENPDTITICDLLTGQLSSVNVHTDKSHIMLEPSDLHTPSVLTSADKDHIYTVMYNIPRGTVTGILIDINTGDLTQLTDDILDEQLIAVRENRLAVAGLKGINIFDSKGTPLSEISYSDESVISMDYHDGTLYCVYPDGKLKAYRETKDGYVLSREVQLSFRNDPYLMTRSFTYRYADSRLYLFHNDDLDVISLDSDASTPLYCVFDHALNYDVARKEIIVSYPAMNGYYPAAYPEFGTDQLIKKALSQLPDH